MKVIVEFVDAHGQPVLQPSKAQLEALANHFAKALLKVRFPEIACKEAASASVSPSLNDVRK
jgi:site-specific DNA recombinase